MFYDRAYLMVRYELNKRLNGYSYMFPLNTDSATFVYMYICLHMENRKIFLMTYQSASLAIAIV